MILQQPWARLVAEGVFPALIRSLPTVVRGRVAIVARGMDQMALVDGAPPSANEFPQPALIGYIEIQDCGKIPFAELRSFLERRFGRMFAEFYPEH